MAKKVVKKAKKKPVAKKTTTKKTKVNNPKKQERLLNETEAAKILGLKPSTLTAWRMTKKNLPFVKVGKRLVRYRMEDIKKYLESCKKE